LAIAMANTFHATFSEKSREKVTSAEGDHDAQDHEAYLSAAAADRRGRTGPQRPLIGAIRQIKHASPSRHGHLPAKNITVVEDLHTEGGSLDGAGNPEEGYIIRGGREMNWNYDNLWDMFKDVPALELPEGYSVLDEYRLVKASCLLLKSRTICRLEMAMPKPVSCAVRRGIVTCPWWCWLKTKRLRFGPKWPAMPFGRAATTVLPDGSSQRSRR